MPLQFNKNTAGTMDDVAYEPPFLGSFGRTLQVQLDVSTLSSSLVDSDGILIPGAPLNYNGSVATPAAGVSDAITGVDDGSDIVSVSGDQTANYPAGAKIVIEGSTANDGVYIISSASYDSTDDETDITVVGTIGDATVDGTVALINHRIYGVTVEPIEVAASNSASDLDSANDIDVALAVEGIVNRPLVEDMLGRALTAVEVAGFHASQLTLSDTNYE